LIHKTEVSTELLENTLGCAPDTLLEFVHTLRLGIQPLSDVASLAGALRSLEFGRIEEELVASSLLAICGKNPKRGLGQVAGTDLDRTRSALRRAVAFLRSTAQIPHIELLPSKEALVVLALFFHEHPAPHPRARQLLTRWIWRQAIQAGDRSEATSLPQALQAIEPGSTDASIRNLLAQVSKPLGAEPDIRLYSLSSAQARMQLSALAALRPRHLVTGEVLDIGQLCEQPGGPAVLLSPEHPEAGLANRILHPQLAEVMLSAELASCEDLEILRSHLISGTSRRALREDFQGFLHSRGQDLQKYVEDFVQSRAEWDASDRDRPALASLIVADE
jgi:hypothetical protein